jgi:hypothetical protein
MHNSNKMVTCIFCRIKGFKHIILGCILRKWKKAREPPVMIRRPKARIPKLLMQRQSPMDARGKESRKGNGKKPEDGSGELQRRQRETDEREKSDKCLSVAEIKSFAETNEEGIKLKTRRRRHVP